MIVERLAVRKALRRGLGVGRVSDVLWTINHPDRINHPDLGVLL